MGTTSTPPRRIVLDGCLDELQLTIAENFAQVHGQELPKVRVNRTGLSRVFSNLIRNALKYKGPEDPVISISAEPQGDFQLFKVSDNGVGIGSDLHPRIFEELNRADSDLGLSLSRRIVMGAGGNMWVESRPGAGSTFFFNPPRRPRSTLRLRLVGTPLAAHLCLKECTQMKLKDCR